MPAPVVDEVQKGMSTLAKTAPHWFAVLVIVGAFLLYLHNHNKMIGIHAERMEIVADQRIEHCHSIQLKGYQVMDRLTQSLDEQRDEFHRLRAELER